MSDIRPPVAWSELQSLANEGKLDPDVVARSVEIDATQSPFNPTFRFKALAGGLGDPSIPSNEIALALRIDKDKKAEMRAEKAASHSIQALSRKLKIAMEGDSWFNLPDVFFDLQHGRYPHDIKDILSRQYDINPLAIWGDKLDNIVHGRTKQYMAVLKGGQRRHFLLSGGGNDIICSIHDYVAPRRPGDSDPRKALSYVKPSFYVRVDELMTLFKEVATDIAGIGGINIVLYVHGYANVIAQPGGKFVGRRLEALGFDPSTYGPLANAIVAALVGIFNEKLKTFASSRANVVYLDLRPHMGPADWNWDEIHPNGKAAERLAAVFSKAIQRHEPSLIV